MGWDPDGPGATAREPAALYYEIARLRDALERYGRHDEGCETETWHGKGPLRCSCGYYEAVEDKLSHNDGDRDNG